MKKITILLFLLIGCGVLSKAQQLNIDHTIYYQTMDGIGTGIRGQAVDVASNHYMSNLMDNLGLSIFYFHVDRWLEFTNDNNDVNVTDWGKFDNAPMTKMTNLAKDFRAKNSNTKLLVTIETPPLWMKEYTTATTPVGSTCDGFCGGRLKSNMYDEFSEYAAAVVGLFKRNGNVAIDALSLQFQPSYATNIEYTSCVYTPSEYRYAFSKVSNKLKKDGYTTKLFGPDHELWIAPTYLDSIVNVDDLAFIGSHGHTSMKPTNFSSSSEWSTMANLSTLYNKPVWVSKHTEFEISGWNACEEMVRSFFMAVKYGNVSGWVYFNAYWGITNWDTELMEDLNGVPTILKQGYVLKQISKYVQPGVKRIHSSVNDANLLPLTFIDEENSRIVTIIYNNATSSKSFSYTTINSQKLPALETGYRSSETEVNVNVASASNYSLPARSITTLVHKSTNKMPIITGNNEIAMLLSDGSKTFNFDVNDGNNNTQILTLNAKTNILNDPNIQAVTFTKNASVGELTINPKDTGTSIINLTAIDNGPDDLFNTQYKNVKVVIIPFINKAPTINNIPTTQINAALTSKQTINLTGITDGDNNSQKLSVTIMSSDPTITRSIRVTYTSGSTGSITFYNNGVGKTDITVTIKDDAGNYLGGSDTKSMTFTLDITNNPSGLNETMENVLLIYPNPANDKITLSSSNEISDVKIYNMVGIVEMQISSQALIEKVIDISNLSTGIYFIEATINNSKIIKRFMKN